MTSMLKPEKSLLMVVNICMLFGRCIVVLLTAWTCYTSPNGISSVFIIQIGQDLGASIYHSFYAITVAFLGPSVRVHV